MVAVGITSASPSLARLLRVVADLPKGAVVLPDLDLSLDEDVWEELGHAGVGSASVVTVASFVGRPFEGCVSRDLS